MQRCVQTCARNTKEIIAAGASRVSASEKLTKIDPAVAALIDHTILKPEATRDDVIKICREAREYRFASVCVNPYWVPLVQGGTVRFAGQGLHRGRASRWAPPAPRPRWPKPPPPCAPEPRKSTW